MDIFYEIKLLFSKANKLINPQIFTIIILIIALFRDKIINLIVIIISKIFNVDKEKINETIPRKMLSAFIIMLAIYLIIELLIKSPKVLSISRKIIKVFAIWTVAMVASSMFANNGPVFQKFKKNNSTNAVLVNNFISRLIRIFIYILAVFIIITELGYNVNGLIAGLGIGSAIIALAVQDFVKNIISGASILSEKPFVIGDLIEIDEKVGTVEDIALRSTKIRLLDNSVMSVPNAKITTENLINIDAIENRKVEINLNLPFSATSKKIARVVNKIKLVLENNPKVLSRTAEVTIFDATQDGLNLRIFCYITEFKFSRYIEIKEKIILDILDIMKQENISPLYNVQTTEVSEMPEIRHVEERKYVDPNE